MNRTLTDLEFTLFQRLILDQTGINIPKEKSYVIEMRLARLLQKFSLSSYGELFNMMYASREGEIISLLEDAITNNETLWFRDKSP